MRPWQQWWLKQAGAADETRLHSVLCVTSGQGHAATTHWRALVAVLVRCSAHRGSHMEVQREHVHTHSTYRMHLKLSRTRLSHDNHQWADSPPPLPLRSHHHHHRHNNSSTTINRTHSTNPALRPQRPCNSPPPGQPAAPSMSHPPGSPQV